MSYRLWTEKTWLETHQELTETFRIWGVKEWQATPGVRRQFADKRSQTIKERTVALRYIHPGGQEVMLIMDRQDRAVDNFRVLYLALEAMRLNEKRGLSDVIQQAYLQLAAPQHQRDPYELLGVRAGADMEIVEAAYRARAKHAHPDAGGSEEQMKELNEALEHIRQERLTAPAL